MAFSSMAKEEIKAIRSSLGLSQAEFAESLGVNQTAVSHWENGLRRPSGAAAILIQQLQNQAPRKKSRIFSR